MSGCQKFREFYTIWWTDLGYLASAFCNSAEGTQVDNFPKVKHAQTKGKKASNVYHCIITEKRTIIFSLFTSTLLKQKLSVQANNKYLLKYSPKSSNFILPQPQIYENPPIYSYYTYKQIYVYIHLTIRCMPSKGKKTNAHGLFQPQRTSLSSSTTSSSPASSSSSSSSSLARRT